MFPSYWKNQLTSFYMMGTVVIKRLNKFFFPWAIFIFYCVKYHPTIWIPVIQICWLVKLKFYFNWLIRTQVECINDLMFHFSRKHNLLLLTVTYWDSMGSVITQTQDRALNTRRSFSNSQPSFWFFVKASKTRPSWASF